MWPDPPERPQVQWLAEFPDPLAERPTRSSFWGNLFRFLVGTEQKRSDPGVRLARPFGLAAIRGGFLIADPDGKQVVRVRWPGGAAEPLRCRQREWIMPMAVTRAPDGAIYVADGGAGAVVRIAGTGACRVIGEDDLERPTGVAFVAGRLFVVDPPRHRVFAFAPSGRKLLSFGGRGDERTEGLNFPTSITATKAGELLVVDALNFRISRYSVDGRWLGSFGEPGNGGGAFARPKAIAEDGSGRLYVSDARHDVVIVFNSNADFEVAVGGSGAGAGDLTLPAGVAIKDELLFVADSYNRRIQIYQLLTEGP